MHRHAEVTDESCCPAGSTKNIGAKWTHVGDHTTLVDCTGSYTLRYDEVWKSFGASTGGQSIFYLNQFSWGNNEQNWYLNNDYHDNYP